MIERRTWTRRATKIAACALMAGSLAACQGRNSSTPRSPGPDANVVEGYRPNAPRQRSQAYLFLPGSLVRQLVQFNIVNGMAVMDGDIMLGTPAQLLLRYGRPWLSQAGIKYANTVSSSSALWPNGQIPYVIDASVDASKRQDIAWAISHVNTTELNVRPRTAADRDYVQFRDAGFDCSSYVGRVGGSQSLDVGGCGRGSIPHEILHAAGFYHEQSRLDRDENVTIVWSEISPGQENNFRKNTGRSQDVGPYDYGSIMHYSARAFSRSGRPTIITKVPNAAIGQRRGLSQLDRAGVTELYGRGGAKPPPTPRPGPGPAPGPGPSNGSFSGKYTSERGDVSCTQSGGSVRCQYPGGGLLCAVRSNELDCAWSGGGQGRAKFQRQSNGVLRGTYGDIFSNTSRGAWSLVPTGGTAPGPTAPPPGPTAPPPRPTGPAGTSSLSGNFSSSRGPMVCDEKGAGLSCTFNENGTNGRLDCLNDASGLRLTCTWATFLPRPGSGRAILTRRSTTDRSLNGTWGIFTATSGGGTWSITPR